MYCWCSCLARASRCAPLSIRAYSSAARQKSRFSCEYSRCSCCSKLRSPTVVLSKRSRDNETVTLTICSNSVRLRVPDLLVSNMQKACRRSQVKSRPVRVESSRVESSRVECCHRTCKRPGGGGRRRQAEAGGGRRRQAESGWPSAPGRRAAVQTRRRGGRTCSRCHGPSVRRVASEHIHSPHQSGPRRIQA